MSGVGGLAGRWVLAGLSGLLLALPATAQDAPPYPPTKRGAVADTLFGERIADPYRWLEADAGSDPEVARWVRAQDAVTRAYLAQLPARDWFVRRIRAFSDFERFGLPVKAGGRYFYTRNTGLLNQSQVFVRQGLGGRPRLLVDPNTWSADGTRALDAWKPSRDGRLLLASVQDEGSDWRTLEVFDVASGRRLPDRVAWARFTELAWVGSRGFLYSRFPNPGAGAALVARNLGQGVWYHRLGTDQREDRLVYATPERPELFHRAQVTADGRMAVVLSANGLDPHIALHTIDLSDPALTPRPLVSGFGNDWRLVDRVGTKLWFVTNQGAPRYRLVELDPARPAAPPRQIVGEAGATLEQGRLIGDRLILSYLQDAASRAVVLDLRGRRTTILALSGIGTATGFNGRAGDPETFYAFSSFNQPPTVYRLDLTTGRSQPFATPQVPFAPGDYQVERRFYASKDGTRVPLFLVRRRDLAAAGKPLPTLLTGYGGFNIALTPSYSAARLAWVDAGGALAVAGVRGGGEYGRAWHDAGRGANKQHSFDDFIAAGDYLVREGIAPQGGLAAQGASNGGLLVAAAINQRPDLFAAANPASGVLDLLRFDRFTEGRTWTVDYGDPQVEADFRVLRAHSPYHTIAGGRDYPAILVTTGEGDDRVVPAHSYKYVAALQHAALGPHPRLLRVEPRTGHGSGKPTDKAIAESADVLAFLAKWTGLEPER